MSKFLNVSAATVLLIGISTTVTRADFVINDDLIVDGSACVGFDCVNGESFGFDTLRLKENNLRIKFDDTSVAASFPRNDWQITANDSANGGAEKFSIDDITGGRTPFSIIAGAPSHSLFVSSSGRIGLKTNSPVVELHIKDGDTPTTRLEQDSSSGFQPQTWDVAGNETNFFIRDVTNGSKLPLRIRPGAPSSSLFIDTDGDIGFGTASPAAKLHVENTGSDVDDFVVTDEGNVGIGTTTPGTNVTINALEPRVRLINFGSGNSTWDMLVRELNGALIFTNDISLVSSPVKFGRFANNDLLRVGFTAPDEVRVLGKLLVNDVELNVPDYVFDPGYGLLPLEDLETFIREKRHLPDVPSKDDLAEAGAINLTEMQMKLLKKVEELTLYTLAQQKTIDDLLARLTELEANK